MLGEVDVPSEISSEFSGLAGPHAEPGVAEGVSQRQSVENYDWENRVGEIESEPSLSRAPSYTPMVVQTEEQMINFQHRKKGHATHIDNENVLGEASLLALRLGGDSVPRSGSIRQTTPLREGLAGEYRQVPRVSVDLTGENRQDIPVEMDLTGEACLLYTSPSPRDS